MWVWIQKSGELWRGDHLIATGYSGAGNGKNNPAMQEVHNVGPIPVGRYTIGAPHDTASHGPYVLTLTPDVHNRMYGRAGFLIHGDSVEHPGAASEGCVILPRAIREAVWASGDTELDVVSGLEPLPSKLHPPEVQAV